MTRHSHPDPDLTPDHGRQPQRVSMVAMVVVFLVAFAIRWPSCGESFWVDELHTAWCAFADWGDVGTRAAIGNQQGGYFYLIAMWNRLMPEGVLTLYGVEAVLRLTSVLLVSSAAAWMVRIVTRTSGSLIGGVAAGLALGLESNAIFFGTELRPYAAIVFLSTAVLSVVTKIMDADFHHSDAIDRTGVVRRIGLHLVVLLAAAVHVTSLTVLAVMVVVFVLADWWRWRTNRSASFVVLSIHGVAGMVWGLVAVLWMQTHESLWHAREAWTSFATANSWTQIGTLWPWGALVVWPVLALTLWAGFVSRGRGRSGLGPVIVFVGLSVATVAIATLTCFVLSYIGGVALWHRRYLVASLPFLCGVLGWAVGGIASGRFGVVGLIRRHQVMSVFTAVACLLLMMSQQRTLGRLMHGETRLARRGEGWKAAIAFTRESAPKQDSVWIDAGLIEQKGQPIFVTDPRLEEYLRYVTGGPYTLGSDLRPMGVGDDALERWIALADESAGHRPNQQADEDSGDVPAAIITRRSIGPASILPPGVERHRFGRVTVLIRRQLGDGDW
ncbi:hypothetical protein [Rhodopirellula sallentina]|uniref:Putative membrane protein n=1 Tax=Rhodopirellula sallentina SM41 TaxID=1263870 RepID=M5TYU1_9BACT|nr:hypothetical protein [Rhodopirellula sallentina]EMI54365.1 putative membrane protein [Rhodopirellula sallentina SM41]